MKKFAVIAILLVTMASCSYMNEQVVTDKVLGKERVSDGSSKYYLVFCENNTFKIEDQIFFGNMRSSDLYGKCRVDSTYQFTIHGYRKPLISMYPVIQKYKQVKNE